MARTGRGRRGRNRRNQRHGQHGFAIFLVSLVVLLILAAVSVKSSDMQEKLDSYEAQAEVLDKEIAEEQERTVEIEEYRKYTQTKKFAEEVAKEKLGLVYEDEILFRQE